MAEGDQAAPAVGSRSFDTKLDHLFKTVRNPETGKPYSLREVSARLPANIPGVTPAYLNQLRKGDKRNPGLELVNSLAKFFGVEPAYFVDDKVAERTDEQLAALYAMKDLQDAMQDPNIPVLAARARGLSPKSMGQLLQLVQTFRELEGLDQTGSDQAEGPNPARDKAAPRSDPATKNTVAPPVFQSPAS